VTKAKSNAKSKAKSQSKKNESGIPKKVAGVKVPKAVRESSFSALFNSSLGREIIADALIAAAGAAAAALTRSRTAKDAGKAVADAGSSAAAAGTDLTQTAAGAVATVVTEAAKSFLPASLAGGEAAAKAEGDDENRPRYVNLASDHNARRVSKKGEKSEKGDKPGKS
jgi:hypothetical protein